MKKLFLTIIVTSLFSSLYGQIYIDKYINDAKEISIKWLNDLNHRNLKNCWDMHSEEAKKVNGSFKSWSKYLNELMQEFGYLKNRDVTNAYFRSSIEGKEDGFYVFVEYSCDYELTENHREVVVLKQNDQAKWRIDAWEYEFMHQEGKETTEKN